MFIRDFTIYILESKNAKGALEQCQRDGSLDTLKVDKKCASQLSEKCISPLSYICNSGWLKRGDKCYEK